MKRRTPRNIGIGCTLLAAFALWTAAVQRIDVQMIGPQGSAVGFATLNGLVHRLTGVHVSLYTVTDWLGLVPFAFALGFSCLGLGQWVQRKSILKVDFSLLALGVFYLAVIAAYVFFEAYVVNYRPVLIDGLLEASYPSSTTMLVLCVMPTSVLQLNVRLKRPLLRRSAAVLLSVFTLFMVLGRLISGVHWFSDILGGVLLSAGLVTLYSAAIDL